MTQNANRSIAVAAWRRVALGLLVALWVWCVGSGPGLAFPRTCWIDQARQQPNGAEVRVNGTVTAASGLFSSANLDNGFAIQDATGGIYVTTDEALNMAEGLILEIAGTLTDDGHGQRMLRLHTWRVSDRPLPAVIPQIASVKTAGRWLDGKLVTVHGEITQPLKEDAPYGDRLWIRDATGDIQIYMPKSTHIDPIDLPFLKPGQMIQVTGISSQYDSNDEIMPRSRADIQPLALDG